jgi:NAD(P)-dependent dehydrogenase (short-subunit alcohol dehydrogenase family)
LYIFAVELKLMAMKTRDFEGKTALVTGGSFGIGKATAIAFARGGANVVVADWVEDADTVNQITSEGGKAIFVKCDVSSVEDVKHMVEQTVKHFGTLDYAFNNAGIEGVPMPTHECTTENWDRIMNINLRGAWLCMKYELEVMHKQGSGCIVNNASIAGLVGMANIPAYAASKHGLIGLTKVAALENGRLGIRVNAVAPGVIRTPMIDRFTGHNKEVEKAFADAKPMGRIGEPEEVASGVLWLCSQGSSFVTGHILTIDGGWVVP